MNETLKVLAWDGFPLSSTHFTPDQHNGKVMLIVPGVGETQKEYAEFAKFFATQGYNTYTFDFRGIGQSRHGKIQNLKTDLRDWAVLDLDAIISYIISTHKQQKLVIAAHGMGGVLIGISRLSKHAESFLFISCQSSNAEHLAGFATKLKHAIVSRILVPIFNATLGYFPASRFGICEDLPQNVVRQLVHWSRDTQNIFAAGPAQPSGFDLLDQKILAINFSDDPIATPNAVEELISFFPRARFERWQFTPDQVVHKNVGHYGFFRKSMKTLVWSEASNWLASALSTSRNKAA
jgi:predicted alpha/beta hydrolase